MARQNRSPNQILPFRVGNQWGFICHNPGYSSSDPNRIVEPRFHKIKPPWNDLIPVQVTDHGDNWGFVDLYGHMHIRAEFDEILILSDEIAGLRAGNEWGFIYRRQPDSNRYRYEDKVVRPKFYGIKPPWNDLIPVQVTDQNGSNWGFADLTGWVRDAKFDEILILSDEVAGLRIGNLWGAIYRRNARPHSYEYRDKVVQPRFYKIGTSWNDLILVKVSDQPDCKWNLADLTQNKLITGDFDENCLPQPAHRHKQLGKDPVQESNDNADDDHDDDESELDEIRRQQEEEEEAFLMHVHADDDDEEDPAEAEREEEEREREEEEARERQEEEENEPAQTEEVEWDGHGEEGYD